MQLGMIGLGRMGINMALRLAGAGHEVVGFDVDAQTRKVYADGGGQIATSVDDFLHILPAPRAIWLMLPQGEPIDATIDALLPMLQDGDTVIDGRSNYHDSQRRGKQLQAHGINFLDVGVSGGVWGLRDGYCLMIGGERAVYERLKPLFRGLSGTSGQGYAYLGASGAGHFAKMVHNGIEYALMEAYAEGFALLAAKEELEFDLTQVAETWRFGSVIRSWLLDLTALVLSEQPTLEGIAHFVEDTGEGRWALSEAMQLGVPMPSVAAALNTRFRSRQDSPFAERLLAALRQQFGGHAVRSS
jgi:6-phosphogluconate dehydrogenase